MRTLTMKIKEVADASCPYEDILTDVCRASVSSMKLRFEAGFRFCNGQNYDGCPIFLAKILRTR